MYRVVIWFKFYFGLESSILLSVLDKTLEWQKTFMIAQNLLFREK